MSKKSIQNTLENLSGKKKKKKLLINTAVCLPPQNKFYMLFIDVSTTEFLSILCNFLQAKLSLVHRELSSFPWVFTVLYAPNAIQLDSFSICQIISHEKHEKVKISEERQTPCSLEWPRGCNKPAHHSCALASPFSLASTMVLAVVRLSALSIWKHLRVWDQCLNNQGFFVL